MKGIKDLIDNDAPHGDVLTPESFQEAVDYLMSDEYAKKENFRSKMRTAGQMTLSRAFEREVITEQEYMHLSTSLAINGMLIVHPKYLDRLKPIADEVALLMESPLDTSEGLET